MNVSGEPSLIFPLVVIGELEAKRDHPELGWFARQALRVLDLHRTATNMLAVITSGMIELGPIQDEENHKLGVDMAKVATDVVLINPKQAEPVLRGLLEANFPLEHIHSVETTSAAIAWMTANAGAGDAVLIMSDLPDTY